MRQQITRYCYCFTIVLSTAHAALATPVTIDDAPASTYLNHLPPANEVDVIGVYTTASGNHPTGNPVVNVQYSLADSMKPITLVLSSYEAESNWQLNIDSGANVQRIIVSGYYTQTVTGAGVFLFRHYGFYLIGYPAIIRKSQLTLRMALEQRRKQHARVSRRSR